jgi:hypothetical protein
MTKQNDHAASTFTIDKDQFDLLIKLLTPGYELSLMYKAQAAQIEAKPEPETKSEET